jgi:hypothetical protein
MSQTSAMSVNSSEPSAATRSVVIPLLPIVAVVFIAFLVIGLALPVLSLHVHQGLGLRFHADGWIVGRKTMQYFARGAARTPGTVRGNLRNIHISDRKGRDVAVAIDPHGTLHYGQDNAEADQIIAVLGEQVSDEYLAELRGDGVSYLFAGANAND